MKIKMFIITCIFNTTLLLGQASEFYINLESQHFLLIDSQGRKSGYNYTPKPYVYEIPYLSYGDDGIGDDDGDNSTYEPIWTMGFDITPFDSAFRESYTLLIQGTKLNRYKGLIYLRAYSRVLSLNISGVIDSLQSISYKLSFSSSIRNSISSIIFYSYLE